MELAEIEPDVASRNALIDHYREVRSFTEELTEPLETEDYVVQAMENVSPAKWHLAHTSWFFETFMLAEAIPNYQSLHPQYHHLFNSYYLQTGQPFTRKHRGLITRPTVCETYQYREYVNQQVINYLTTSSEEELKQWAPVVEIGLHHEQQHQELIVTDIKYNLAQNPLGPVYKEITTKTNGQKIPSLGWVDFKEGIYEIGHEGGGYSYDNEHPRHKRFQHAFEIADRLITNAEFIEFIEDNGYKRSELWLSDGFAAIKEKNWNAPLYWQKKDGQWFHFTLSGVRPVVPNEPVTHISYYEADAYAEWSGARLPDEAEWEIAANTEDIEGNFVDNRTFHPQPLSSKGKQINQLFGDTWEWTKSAYDAYPGYAPLPGALGEYNGKFMSSQYVLRGGSCASSKSHIRRTYRNFFYPDARWQFSGIRLARLK